MSFKKLVPALLAAVVTAGCSHGGGSSGGGYSVAPSTSTAIGNSIGVVTSQASLVPANTAGVGRFVYTSDAQNPAISQFSVDPTSGALTFVALSSPVGTTPPGAPDAGVFIMAADDAGRFLYAFNTYSGDVAGFKIDPTSGALTKFDQWNLPNREPVGGYISPDGKWLVVHAQPAGTNTGEGWLTTCSIDPTTGELSAISELALDGPHDPVHLVFDRAGGILYGVGSRSPDGNGANMVSQFAMDASGTITEGAQLANAAPVWSLVVDPKDARVFVLGADGSVTTYPRDATGALTQGTTVPAVGGGYSIAVSPSGLAVYVTEQLQPAGGTPSDALQAYSVDPATGALTADGAPVPCGPRPTRVRVDPSGLFGYTCDLGTNHISTFALDPTTGAATAAGTSQVCSPTTANPTGPTTFWVLK